MKVSVVVCIYSMERYDCFSEAVESVLDQTYEPLEVVDGNNTVLEYFKAVDRRARYLRDAARLQ